MILSLPSSTNRAQSATVGVVLLTAVVVVITAVVGGVVLSGIGADSQDPVVDIRGNATSQHVMVTHNGGDSLPRSDVDIITDGNQRVRHSLNSYTQRIGSDNTRFERGDSWRRSNAVTGDQLTLIAIHIPSNTVLDREKINVRVTSFARFTYDPQNPTPTSTVEFNASDSEFEGGTVASYEWDFDDDGNAENTTETASYSFPDDGDYPVTLTVTADDGRTANLTKTVTVFNEFPSASFSYSPGNPKPNQEIEFNASTSNDPDGTISSYEWDFDEDGVTDKTGKVVKYTYTSTGDKTAKLTVTDDDGVSKTESQTVSVQNSNPPSVTITGSSSSATGNSGQYDIDVTFEASDPNGDITNYTVILYDSSAKTTELDRKTASPYDGSETTVTVSDSDSNSGTNPHYVVVRVGDSKGQIGSAEEEVDADNGVPTASFDYNPSNPAVGQSITFDASGSTDPESDSLTYEWDWTNDGTVDTTTTDPDDDATHSYSNSGTYTVSLTVKDGNGGVDTTTETVSVGSKDFTSVSASDMSKNANSATQTFTFTVDEALADGETVTINLDDPQSVKNNPDPVDYRAATVDETASSLDGGFASLSASTDTATLTFTANGQVDAGTQVSIEIDGVDTGNIGGNEPDPQVIFTRSDGLQASDTFTLTN